VAAVADAAPFERWRAFEKAASDRIVRFIADGKAVKVEVYDGTVAMPKKLVGCLSAVLMIAFGRLTIAHRLVRVLVLEQIYRGFKILRGEPYHRD